MLSVYLPGSCAQQKIKLALNLGTFTPESIIFLCLSATLQLYSFFTSINVYNVPLLCTRYLTRCVSYIIIFTTISADQSVSSAFSKLRRLKVTLFPFQEQSPSPLLKRYNSVNKGCFKNRILNSVYVFQSFKSWIYNFQGKAVN